MKAESASICICLITFSLTIFTWSGTAQAEETEVQALIRRVETQYQGRTSHAVAHMKITTEYWSREIVMEMWSRGRDTFLARILSPKKDEGVATLKIGGEMWNYLPNIDRLIKIPSSMMGESWMGSHLTNDDLVKENQVDKLYDLTLKKEGGEAEVTGIPKSEAPVVWGKLVYRIEMKRLIPLFIDYYDEENRLVRKITFDRVKEISGRAVPLHMVVQPVDKPKERTELTYTKLEFDIKLSDDLFSIRSLRRQ
jgi:outer membrane lipoprotein-sorting protein